MKIWVDTNDAPSPMKEIVFRAALRLEVEAVLLANQPLQTPASNCFVTSVREEGARTIDPRGEEYTQENVGERLSIRDFMDQLRSTGVETGGPKTCGAKEKQAFAATFYRVLAQVIRAWEFLHNASKECIREGARLKFLLAIPPRA